MKKLLTLILGVVLFSGAAYAKIYWLPDYLQDNMDRSAGRVTEDTTNRTAGCSAGGYYNSPLGSGYNCSRVVYAHQACYSCTAKPCPSGYTAGLTKCAAKTGYSASYSSNGISGTQTCGKCDYKELSCASGYSTSYQSVSNCGTTGSAGWTFTSNGYSGTKLCGKCTAKTCLSGYSTTYSDVSKCGSRGSKGWSWEKSSQYAGNSVCGKCTKLSCNSPYASGITSCSPSDGYALKQDSGRYNGDTVCGYCQPNNCSGTKQSDCNTSNGYTFTQTCKSGTTIYGTCKANTCSGVTSVAQCGSSGSSGWNWTANGCKSAGTSYGNCSKKSCASGVVKSACDTASGAKIWTAISGVYSGNDQCGTCEDAKKDCRTIIAELTGDEAGVYVSNQSEMYRAVYNDGIGQLYLANDITYNSATGLGVYMNPTTGKAEYLNLTFRAAADYCDDAAPDPELLFNAPMLDIDSKFTNYIRISTSPSSSSGTYMSIYNNENDSAEIINYGSINIKEIKRVDYGDHKVKHIYIQNKVATGKTKSATFAISSIKVPEYTHINISSEGITPASKAKMSIGDISRAPNYNVHLNFGTISNSVIELGDFTTGTNAVDIPKTVNITNSDFTIGGCPSEHFNPDAMGFREFAVKCTGTCNISGNTTTKSCFYQYQDGGSCNKWCY